MNPNETLAIEFLEQAFNVIESNFRQLRDENLNSLQLFEMRIALQDACDTIMLATRHIECVQREVELTEPEQD
jgi:predicted Zn-dependent protease